MKERIYAYSRISTAHQSIDRQIRNILEKYPNAIVIKEYYTGTKIEGRSEWNKLYNQVKKDLLNDYNITIVFDEVTRMSRNEIDGFNLYQELFNLGVNLVFLKDQHINTDVYRKALSIEIPMTNSNVDILLKANIT